MKATLKLEKIEKASLGTTFVKLSLTLVERKTTTFLLSTAGLNIRIESSHLLSEIQTLMEWLELETPDTDNLRNNRSEVILFGKEILKANKVMQKIKSI